MLLTIGNNPDKVIGVNPDGTFNMRPNKDICDESARIFFDKLKDVENTSITEAQYNRLYAEVFDATPLVSSYLCKGWRAQATLSEALAKYNIKVERPKYTPSKTPFTW